MFKTNIEDPELAELDLSIRNVAYTTGFVYQRWLKGINVQILKRSRDFDANSLRTILLLEAYLNMNNKKLGKEVLWKSECDRTLAKENYGGRKKFRAVEMSFNQHLT